MVERKRTEGRACADAALRREDRNRRRDRGKRTEDDCGAKTAIHAAHDTYGLALPLSGVKLRIQVRLRLRRSHDDLDSTVEIERSRAGAGEAATRGGPMPTLRFVRTGR